MTAHRPYAGDTTLPSTAWHAEFQDVNTDAYVDLFVAKGNVEAMPDYAARDPSNLLLGQPDGTFVEGAEAAGMLSFARARGAALVDLNLDGMLDLVVVNRRENVGLWRNVGRARPPTGADGQLVALRLRSARPEPRRDRRLGRGAQSASGSMRREVTVGGGHAGGQLGLDRTSASGSAERRRGLGAVAGRRGGPWRAGRGQSLRDRSSAARPSRPYFRRSAGRR